VEYLPLDAIELVARFGVYQWRADCYCQLLLELEDENLKSVEE